MEAAALTVVSVEWIDDEADVYDITVEEDESFIVCDAVVHNCPTCRSLDQLVFPLKKGPRSPIHPFCRCVMVPVFDERFAFLQKGGTRASAGAGGGKQVAANMTFYTWLKTQPRSFIELAIGPKRAKLLLDGGLSAERFAALQIDKNWQPLTLNDMRALEPIAFERAGL